MTTKNPLTIFLRSKPHKGIVRAKAKKLFKGCEEERKDCGTYLKTIIYYIILFIP